MSNVANDYRSALKRLLLNQPQQVHNRADDGSINISIKSVAQEAQRSRTPISTIGGPYSKTRELILRVIRRVKLCKDHKYRGGIAGRAGNPNQSHSLVKINADLRRLNSELNKRIDMYATLLAEADQQLRIYQKGEIRVADAADRVAKRADRLKRRR
jgi:hypothetical protein